MEVAIWPPLDWDRLQGAVASKKGQGVRWQTPSAYADWAKKQAQDRLAELSGSLIVFRRESPKLKLQPLKFRRHLVKLDMFHSHAPHALLDLLERSLRIPNI